MTRTSQETRPANAVAEAPGPLRLTFGGLRLIAGLLILVAIIVQIVDLVVNRAFKPGEYFAYFTIQSSMMNVVVLLVGGVVAFRTPRDTPLFTNVRMAILAYAVVTGVVYNLLLRNIPPTGFQGIHWPTEVMHVGIPIFIVLDWLIAPGRARVPWKALWLAASYPLAWLAFTMIRGGITGWYPYPFLEPSQPGGIVALLLYIVGIAGFIVAIAAGGIALTRIGEGSPALAGQSTGREGHAAS